MRRRDGYAPIEAYAAIGDGRTAALVALDGAIDFLGLPALHSPTTFGALLDPGCGGRFVLRPEGRFDAERRYVGRTNVLETTYRTRDGCARVTEALTLRDGLLLPWVEVARRVEGLAGTVSMRWDVEPRFDWGRESPQIVSHRGTPVAAGGGVEAEVHAWDVGEPRLEESAVRGAFETREGSTALLALCASYRAPVARPRRSDVERRLDGTVDAWERWLRAWRYDGPWEEHVARSALALKLLVYAPLGAIAAAATTSLPERIGGDRNYDYRYMWVRDTSFVLDALMRLGLSEQVHESYECLLRAVRTTAPEIQPFYSLEGGEPRRFDELRLAGYRGSRPVRDGNAARRQLQLGSWGDLLEATDLYVRDGHRLDRGSAALLAGCVDRLQACWVDEDSGMWELADSRHYTSAKLAAWAAFDRALRLADEGELPSGHAARWRTERDAVARFVQERCWSDEIQSYVEFAGGDVLDAALLRAPRLGWDGVDGGRVDLTIAAIRDGLDAGGGLLYRTTRTRDEEGAFVACSFWLAEALARRGSVEEAADRFERVLGYANDVGLLAEEVDPGSGAHLGNFPQALSHLALVNAAGAIQDARAAASPAAARAAAR